jgi:uncharacterized membrane protein
MIARFSFWLWRMRPGHRLLVGGVLGFILGFSGIFSVIGLLGWVLLLLATAKIDLERYERSLNSIVFN